MEWNVLTHDEGQIYGSRPPAKLVPASKLLIQSTYNHGICGIKSRGYAERHECGT